MAGLIDEHEYGDRIKYNIVNGKVYDLTEFAKVHPGGSEWFAPIGGRDITNLFWTYHKYPEKNLSILAKYEVNLPDAKPYVMLPAFLLKEGFDAVRYDGY